MSKEDTASGLLSKMVKFVRNPATNWADLDAAATDRDEAMSKQLLKEMIERKRQNDFVRKREFDMLRKMRKREAMVGVGQDPTGRPSFFQSSMPSKPDDRATTLKKIDEIEAQMSMQWWKTKNGGIPDSTPPHASPTGARNPSVQAPLLDNALPTAYRATAPAGVQSPVHKPPEPTEAAPLDASPTAPDSLSIALAEARAGGAAPARPSAPAPATAPVGLPGGLAGISSRSDEGGSSGFSHSKFSAVDVDEGVEHDAELEEAAIRFANGDDAGAEAGLLEILAPNGS